MTLLVSRSQHLTIWKTRAVKSRQPVFRQPICNSGLGWTSSTQLTHLVLACREEIGVPRADGETADGRDVAGERDLQLARGQVPDLDDPVAGAGRKPLVSRLDGDGPNPAEVARDDTRELPWSERGARKYLGVSLGARPAHGLLGRPERGRGATDTSAPVAAKTSGQAA
jgi:hypothetical protein